MLRGSIAWGRGLLCALMMGCAPRPGDVLFDIPFDAAPGDGGSAPSPPRPGAPTFAPRAASRTSTPPLSGGTLLILRDDRSAVVADPDHDVVWIADLEGVGPARLVALLPGDEPGRAAQGAGGLVYVVARGGGALVTVDPTTASVVARRAVCAEPRGVAWDERAEALHVACAGGELVTLPPAGPPTRKLRLPADLRDVVALDGRVFVTRFRSASLLLVDGDAALELGPPPSVAQSDSVQRDPLVAWRTFAAGGRVVMLHQFAVNTPLGATLAGAASPPVYYGTIDSPTAPIHPRLSWTAPSARGSSASWSGAGGVSFPAAGLTVDAAVHADAGLLAVVSPGWAFRQGPAQVSVYRGFDPAAAGDLRRDHDVTVPGQAVAAAFTRGGRLVVQTRSPGALVVDGSGRAPISLYRDEVGDTGQEIFHATTVSGLACASCHPEGDDDGRTWTFRREGRRRTMSLRGGVLATAPFHWGGELATMDALIAEVFTRRMGGPRLVGGEMTALARWIDALPPRDRAAPDDRAAVERGGALFRSAETGCAGCHGGGSYTNNQTVDVGTGGAFQVPSLRGLGWRGPYLHDGCGDSLRRRFTDARCGGGDRHGATAWLSSAQVDDLVAFLQTL